MSELAARLSLRATKKQNVIRLLQNQIRLLEAEGASAEEIWRILDVGRALLFRLKAAQPAARRGLLPRLRSDAGQSRPLLSRCT